MSSDKPNIILIVVDALRPDHLSCYGYHRRTSPNLDRLAEESVLFESAFAASPSTVGSIPSILTGLYPSIHETGVDGNVLQLHRHLVTLPDVLKRNGYATVGFNTNPLVAGKHGYDNGFIAHFDVFPSEKKTRLLQTAQYFSKALPQMTLPEFRQPYVCSAQINKRIADWLQSGCQEPFFMWVHYMDTHAPYLPREPYFSRYAGAKSDAQISSFLVHLNEIYKALYQNARELSPLAKQLVQDCYDSEISYFDHNLREFLNSLEKLSLLDNTILVITADHGEEFWEHGQWGHYIRMYDINLHVPLLIKCPSLGQKGKTVSKQIRNIDIFPTLCELLNLQVGQSLSGLSLVPVVESDNLTPEIPVVAEGGGVIALSTKEHVDRLYSIRTTAWKYIKNVTQNTYQLYELEKDPRELTNLAHEPEKNATIEELDRDLTSLLMSAVKHECRDIVPEFDSQVRKQLAALGYV